jgi:tetratricopeptide (TPR) repeat protein
MDQGMPCYLCYSSPYNLTVHRYSHVLVINARSDITIRNDIQHSLRSLDLGFSQITWEEALQYLSLKSDSSNWLLVFDNADDPEVKLTHYFPQCSHGTIIVTTRNRNYAILSNAAHWELKPMADEQAVRVLYHSAHLDVPVTLLPDEEGALLVQELGCLPLALVQAGSYCFLSEEPITFGEYLQRLKNQRDFLKSSIGDSIDTYQLGVYAALDLSYESPSLTSQHRQFLHLLSSFEHSNISLSMLAFAAENEFKDFEDWDVRSATFNVTVSHLMEVLPSKNGPQYHLHQMILSLRRFSLIEVSNMYGTTAVRLHTLVARWLLHRLGDESNNYHAMATQIVTTSCYEDGLKLHHLLLPHVLHLTTDKDKMHSNDIASFATVLHTACMYAQAAEMLQLLESRLANKGNTNPLLRARASFNLAAVYGSQGLHIEAEIREREVLSAREELLGRKHLETLRAIPPLANTLLCQGRLSEARQLFVRSYSDFTSISSEVMKTDECLKYGKTIFEYAQCAANIYCLMDEYDKAQENLEVCYRSQSRILGENHKETIQTKQRLAEIYMNQGKLLEAERILTKIQEFYQRRLGPYIPDAIKVQQNLAEVYHQQGRLLEAEELLSNLLLSQAKKFGNSHKQTLGSVARLGRLYTEQRQWNKAEVLLQQYYDFSVLTEAEDVDNANAVATNPFLTGLADIFVEAKISVGQPDVAELLLHRLLNSQKCCLHEDHFKIPVTLNKLAFLYRSQGRLDEAADIQKESLEIVSRSLGQRNSTTLNSVFNLAQTYMDQSRFKEAAQLMGEGLRLRKEVLGSNHPTTLESSVWLAFAIHQQGHPNGLKMLANACKLVERRLGIRHPKTLTCMERLGTAYWKENRLSDLISLQKYMINLLKEEVGLKHQSTLQWIWNLGTAYAKNNDMKNGIEVLTSLLSLKKEVSGEISVDVFGTLVVLASLYLRTEQKELYDDTLQSARDILAKIPEDNIETNTTFKYHVTWFRLFDNRLREYDSRLEQITLESQTLLDSIPQELRINT